MNLVNELTWFGLICLAYMIAVFISLLVILYLHRGKKPLQAKDDSPGKKAQATNAATTMPCASLSNQGNTNTGHT